MVLPALEGWGSIINSQGIIETRLVLMVLRALRLSFGFAALLFS